MQLYCNHCQLAEMFQINTIRHDSAGHDAEHNYICTLCSCPLCQQSGSHSTYLQLRGEVVEKLCMALYGIWRLGQLDVAMMLQWHDLRDKLQGPCTACRWG
jgi:transposase-like protein